MRLINKKENLNYSETKSFFEKRAKKYNENNPYSVTMYQDNNAELVEKRNKYETDKLLKLINLNGDSKVLDLACGIGRWADAIGNNIERYVGVDFSEGLIDIAKKRNKNPKAEFITGSSTEIDLLLNKDDKFNRVLIVGLLMYLNDEDVTKVFEQAEKFCSEHATICIREPIGITDRLTLKEFYSEELKDNYNAIYRTDAEFKQLMQATLFEKGFKIKQEGFLFDDDALNNRKETSQYFYILER